MHSLTIVFGPSPVPWILLFKTEESVNKAMVAFDTSIDTLSITDDFGQRISVQRNAIHGLMFEDMDLSKMAHVEQGLHRARTQAKAQQMAASDPVLRTAAMAQGPAMLQPGFNNGAFRGQ